MLFSAQIRHKYQTLMSQTGCCSEKDSELLKLSYPHSEPTTSSGGPMGLGYAQVGRGKKIKTVTHYKCEPGCELEFFLFFFWGGGD